MGKYFIDARDLHRIELEDGEWVDVKARMSFGDLQKIRAATFKITQGLDRSPAVEVLAAEAQVVTLLHNIVAWSFSNEDGNPLAVSRASIERLAPEIANRILEVIDQLNAPKSGSAASGGGEAEIPVGHSEGIGG